MPIITIEWFEGRDGELKKEMAEKLTDLMVDVGKTQREHVWIRFVDSPKSEWSMGGEIQG